MSTLWVYLSTSPLLWLCLTLGAYRAALALQQRCGGSPWLNPVLLAVLMLVALLQASGTPYARYFEGAQFVHFLLGTATVALAVPLRRHWAQLRPQLGGVFLGVLRVGGDLFNHRINPATGNRFAVNYGSILRKCRYRRQR